MFSCKFWNALIEHTISLRVEAERRDQIERARKFQDLNQSSEQAQYQSSHVNPTIGQGAS